MEYESGEMGNHHDLLRLFSHLIRTGQAWTLQGEYGRNAKRLIDRGAIAFNHPGHDDGDILMDPDDLTEEDLE